MFAQVVSGDAHSSVHVWSIESGELTFRFGNAHGESKITAMSFDASMRRLLTGAGDGTVHLWNFNNGQCLKTCNNSGQEIAKHQGNQDTPNKLPVELARDVTQHSDDNPSGGALENEVTALLYILEQGGAHDITNQYVVTAGWDRKIKAFSDTNDEEELSPARVMPGPRHTGVGHTDDVQCIAHCPPQLVASGSYDGLVILWSLETGRPKFYLDASQYDESGAIADGVTLEGHERAQKVAGMSTKWRHKSFSIGEDRAEQTRNAAKGEPVDLTMRSVECMVYLKRQKCLATAGGDGCIRFWSVKSGALSYVLHGRHPGKAIDAGSSRENDGMISSIESDAANDDNHLFTGCSDGYIKIWRLLEGEDLCLRTVPRLKGKHHHGASKRTRGSKTPAPPSGSPARKWADSPRNGGASSAEEPATAVASPEIFKAAKAPKQRMRVAMFELGGWKAHDDEVASIQYIAPGATGMVVGHGSASEGLLLTSSTDCNIALWTMGGSCIGIFGVSTTWSLQNPLTWENVVDKLPQIVPESEEAGQGDIETETPEMQMVAAREKLKADALRGQEELERRVLRRGLERRVLRKGGGMESYMDDTTTPDRTPTTLLDRPTRPGTAGSGTRTRLRQQYFTHQLSVHPPAEVTGSLRG